MFKFSPKFQKMRKKGQGLVRKAYRAVKKLSEVLVNTVHLTLLIPRNSS
jgi:hypothetical protein